MKAYKIYDLLKTESKLWLRMHVSILKGLAITHLVVLVVALVVSVAAFGPSDRAHWQQISRRPALSIRSFNPLSAASTVLDLPSLRLFLQTLIFSPLIYVLWPVIIFIARRRSKHFQNKTIRGAELISIEEFQHRLRQKEPLLQITESIAIPHDAEPRHIIVTGSSGVGKTNWFSQYLEAVRPLPGKKVIYEAKDGEAVAKHYRPETDLLFNPFDQRSIHWDVLEVITAETDFDSLAGSVIPTATDQGRFFHDAARDVLAAIFRFCYRNDRKTNDDIWALLCKPVPELHKLLRTLHSPAASYICNYYSGQTQGVLSTLQQFAGIFKYLVNSRAKSPFSLREWVRNEHENQCLFLTNNTKQRETLEGILALFLNSLSNEILSLRDDPERRIRILLDELPTLRKMDSIPALVSLGRSKGACLITGFQNKEQLDSIYSKNIADTLVNNCSNYVIFRNNGYYTAEYMSGLLGDAERDFSLVLAEKDLQSGESYRNYTKLDKLALPSEIQNLKPLQVYLKIHDLPATLTSFEYKQYADKEPAFVPNTAFLPKRAGDTEPRSDSDPHDIIQNKSSAEIDSEKDLEGKDENEAIDQHRDPHFSVDDFNF